MERNTLTGTPIEDAISEAFYKTGCKELSFGDLCYLLLQHTTKKDQWIVDWEPKRYVTKREKRLYKEWREKFAPKTPLKELSKNRKDLETIKEIQWYQLDSWEHPFRRYRMSPQNLSLILNKMCKLNALKKRRKGKKVFYSLSAGYFIDVIKKSDKAVLDRYPSHEIFSNLWISIYGAPSFPADADFTREFGDIITSFRETMNRLIQFKKSKGVEHLEDKWNEIMNGDFPLLDKQLALIYRYAHSYNVQQMKNFFELKNGKIVIKPDTTLVTLFQQKFYLSLDESEVFHMLDNYELNSELALKLTVWIELFRRSTSEPTVIIHPYTPTCPEHFKIIEKNITEITGSRRRDMFKERIMPDYPPEQVEFWLDSQKIDLDTFIEKFGKPCTK